MIIDSHGHTVAPPEVYAYQSKLMASRGYPHIGHPNISDEELEIHLAKHLQLLDGVGTDVQIISPRPFHAMHSVKPELVVHKWTEFVNNIIARQVKLHPDRFLGMAGLPQSAGVDVRSCLPELERAIKQLGFVGCLLNPDPMEGERPAPPGLGDEYWYPLYEKLVELNVPALVHSAGCCSPREAYTLHFINEESIAILSLLDSNVFRDFPGLKIIIAHGGGAIPYQMGRFRAWRYRQKAEDFDTGFKRLYYDTCNYDQDALELLFKVAGADNVLFGTEKPGTGSALNPQTGRMMDDVKSLIDNIAFLSDDDKSKIYEINAKKLFNLK